MKDVTELSTSTADTVDEIQITVDRDKAFDAGLSTGPNCHDRK